MLPILLFSTLVASSTSLKLTGVRTLTDRGWCVFWKDRCGMDNAIRLYLRSDDYHSCNTNFLNSRANDYEEGDVNHFDRESSLGDCSSYEFSQRPIYAEIQHNAGEDGWCAKEIWLDFSDNSTEHHYINKCLLKNNKYSWRCMENRSRDIKLHHNYNFSFTSLLYYIILSNEVLTSF